MIEKSQHLYTLFYIIIIEIKTKKSEKNNENISKNN